jgi:sugar-phosphatase
MSGRLDIVGELVSVNFKAVLFDMDGTLVDSTQVVELAWGGWAVRHNIPLEDVLSFSHGRPTIATLEHFLP